MPEPRGSVPVAPEEALFRLAEGNRRFLEKGGHPSGRPWATEMAQQAQHPFAIVLGCSDSRTPVEILFDQGFGDLFVVRVAGNIVAPSVVGSIEFAASQFGTRLVVVLGHSRCGAITATVRAVETGHGPESRNIRSITDRIMPHVEKLVRPTFSNEERVDLLREAMRANVRASADQLRHASRLLEDQVLGGQLVIVSAEYELETGHVHFFDGVPARRAAATDG
ncbi:MAG TPA: carbonic anhydrase [Polyangiaceae bacterium]